MWSVPYIAYFMKQITLLLGIVLLFLFTACGESHFMKDTSYRKRVEQDFQQKQTLMPKGDLFAVFNTELTSYEREALEFLYAYMPLADITDYSGDFHLMNVRASQQAAKEMPWGKAIPEELFRHFVLPTRVNNENLDSARVVFYKELKDRVKSLSLYDAILEVNHWCHEKAVYTPSDSRTSSPLATVRTAYGRCGEESTFLVAALRSVGIPARQVYTPRWAHTDDNHAWVEAWADGKWYFLGACEPEPVLNLGWFNAPASRGMLMHTKVFGRYEGAEEVMSVTPNFTEINVIENYTPEASKASVIVKDEQGKPIADALVEFKLYNYAEYYTVATKQTDANGTCGLTAGKGDMLVWVSKDGRFGFSKLSFGKDKELTVTMDKSIGDNYSIDFDIVPPAESANLPAVTPEQRAENDRRVAHEDSIRNAYVATFMIEESARNFAKEYKLDEDAVAKLLLASRGNHEVIRNFMARLRSDDSRKGGINLLQQISPKDLRDVSLEVLIDHMMSRLCKNVEYFRKYVRNPRVSNEMLTPYKSFFGKAIPKEEAEIYVSDPMKLVAWVTENIQVDKDCNLGGAPISPAGVWKARMADAHSRDIFFVSMARSMGIPARIDEVTGKVQLINDDGAVDVNFGATEQASAQKGRLVAKYTPVKSLDNPKYYSHFTISKVTPQGNLQLLTYDEGDSDMGEGTTWSNLLKEGTSLDAGDYILVTGTRLASGAVLSKATSFSIMPGETTNIELVMRESKDDVQVIGSFNSETMFAPLQEDCSMGDCKQTLLQACGRGYYVVGILGVNQEPTNHALRDIAAFKADLEKWGRKMVLLFPDEVQSKKFVKSAFPNLPSTIIYGIDTDGIAQQIAENMKLKHKETLPIFIIADTFNRVVFISQGYTIGLGEQLMKTIHGL